MRGQWVRGSVPGGFRGTQGGRVPIYPGNWERARWSGLSRVLTDHLLERIWVTLIKSPVEAHSFPRDLSRWSLWRHSKLGSPSQQMPVTGARALFPQDSTHHTFAHTVSATWNALPVFLPSTMGSAVLRQHRCRFALCFGAAGHPSVVTAPSLWNLTHTTGLIQPTAQAQPPNRVCKS